eukprot:2906766-Rhodomonas_salina.1
MVCAVKGYPFVCVMAERYTVQFDLRRVVLTWSMLLCGVRVCCYAVSGTEIAYDAMRCPVLRWRMLLYGTEIAYARSFSIERRKLMRFLGAKVPAQINSQRLRASTTCTGNVFDFAGRETNCST